MSERSTVFLADISREAVQVQEFIEGQTFAAFVKDIKTQYAARLSLAHIGEAVKRLPAELTEQHPHSLETNRWHARPPRARICYR